VVQTTRQRFFRGAEHQFKSIGQLGLRVYLKACTARGVVNNSAINNGSFRTNDEFGLRTPACRPNASKPSRIHYSSLSITWNPSDRFTDYPENSFQFSIDIPALSGARRTTSWPPTHYGTADQLERERTSIRRF